MLAHFAFPNRQTAICWRIFSQGILTAISILSCLLTEIFVICSPSTILQQQRKRTRFRAFSLRLNVPDRGRTCGSPLRRRILYPAEVLGHIIKKQQKRQSPGGKFRRQPLYPTELSGHYEIEAEKHSYE